MDLFSSATKIEERLVRSATQKRIPLGGAFELLPLCNMNCKMCFLRLSPEELKARGRLRTVEEWLALAVEAKQEGLIFLLLTGGEPFLYPDFKELYIKLSEMGFHITLNTNGTLINEEYADLLQKYPPRRVNITLYGSSREIYRELCGNANAFDQVMKAIDLLKQRNVAVKLNGSLTRYNMDDLKEIQKIAHDLEIPLEVDHYMFPCSRKGTVPFDKGSRLTPKQAAEGFMKIRKDELSEEDFFRLSCAMSECYQKCQDSSDPQDMNDGEAEVLPCRAGRSSFWITWEGKMSMCVFLENMSVPVFETGFAKAWKKIQEYRDKIQMPKACTQCEKRHFCTVCGACAYTETGAFDQKPEYMCELTQEKLRLMDEYVKERRV